MAEVLRERFPDVTVTIGDIQAKTSYSDAFFDRVIAIHVLEHLPYLPAALSEVHRMLKPDGIFSVVIPCEGGLAQSLAREISSVRMFKKKFGDTGVDYRWLITKTEHVNAPSEIFKEIEKYFTIEHKEYFPLKVPFVFCNLCIGMHLQKKAL
jgi:ubiquinone/menaquinone biosynthesis C-methylase UbiE